MELFSAWWKRSEFLDGGKKNRVRESWLSLAFTREWEEYLWSKSHLIKGQLKKFAIHQWCESVTGYVRNAAEITDSNRSSWQNWNVVTVELYDNDDQDGDVGVCLHLIIGYEVWVIRDAGHHPRSHGFRSLLSRSNPLCKYLYAANCYSWRVLVNLHGWVSDGKLELLSSWRR